MAVNRKKILELHDFGDGLSIRQVSEATGNSRNTVRSVVRGAEELGITREVLAAETPAGIEAMYAEAKREQAEAVYEEPDFEYMVKELGRPGVNRKLLWHEYSQECAAKGATPYQYSRFCELFKEWAKKLDVTVRIVHKPGYACQVDWVGDTSEVVFDRVTGEVSRAYYFVMTMPYSGCMYVEAFPDMKMPSWIAGHNHAYRFFGGAPAITVPDNLKCGVAAPDPYEPLLNETYNQLADHFGTAVVPAKVYCPKGKAQVERTVKIVETWVVAALRNERFHTFDELNRAVRERVAWLNEQTARDRDACRLDIFKDEEAEHLSDLPSDDFELAEWRKARVQRDCHIQFDRMRYSVPCAYIGCDVDVRATYSTVAVYSAGQLVCMHRRLRGRIGQYSTVEEHMPDHLRTSPDKLWSERGFTEWAAKVGPSTEACVRAILGSKRVVEQGYRACRGLKSLADKKGYPTLEAACAEALAVTSQPSYTQVKNLLARAEAAPLAEADTDQLVDGAVGSLGFLRDPGDYTGFLPADGNRSEDGEVG